MWNSWISSKSAKVVLGSCQAFLSLRRPSEGPPASLHSTWRGGIILRKGPSLGAFSGDPHSTSRASSLHHSEPYLVSPVKLLSEATTNILYLVCMCIFQPLRMKSRPINVAQKTPSYFSNLSSVHGTPTPHPNSACSSSKLSHRQFLPLVPTPHASNHFPWWFVLGLDVNYSRKSSS